MFVCEIVKLVDVNVVYIFYYFKGKGGLMEYLVFEFYEGYIEVLENVVVSMNGEDV